MNESSGTDGERIAKRIARAGLCSRRTAEKWISDGRIAIDGATIASPATLVGPGTRITVDGAPLKAPDPARLWRYHKPKGLVTTHRDTHGRRTVFDALPSNLPRVISIGRLDLNSEGLLLLTNDGEIARHLERSDWARRYRVRVFGRPDQGRLRSLAKGLDLGGVHYEPIEAKLDRIQGDNAWLTLSLREGKNREVRHVLEHIGLTVNRLIRIAFGPFQLGRLAPGDVAEVPAKVIAEQLSAPAATRQNRTEASAGAHRRR